MKLCAKSARGTPHPYRGSLIFTVSLQSSRLPLTRELSVGLREFFAKKHLADKHNFDLINGRLRRRRIFTVSTVILCGRTQFAPNSVQFPLQFCLRDAEDVIPYDRIAVDSLYIQQNFDLSLYRTIPPSWLTPCHLPLHKGGEGKCKHFEKIICGDVIAFLQIKPKSAANLQKFCEIGATGAIYWALCRSWASKSEKSL